MLKTASKISRNKQIYHIYPLSTAKERISVWKEARGIWKNKKPDPIQELKKIREGLNRKLPIFGSK